MRSQNFTFKYFDLFFKTSALMAIMLLSVTTQLQAQCQLSCGDVQISLNDECEAEITPELLLTNALSLDCDGYYVVITDLNDVELGRTILQGTSFIHPVINRDHIGTLKASVIASFLDDDDEQTSITCWSYLVVEDKLGPSIQCLEDVTVSCLESYDEALETETSQNFVAEDITDTNTASNIVDFQIDAINTSNPWELITNLSVNLTVSPSSVTASDLTVQIFHPTGGSPYSTTFDGNLWVADNMPPVGVQTTDGFINGLWDIRVVHSSGTANIEVTAANLNIDSRSIFLAHPAVADNCTDPVNIEFVSDDIVDIDCENEVNPQFGYKRVISYQAIDDYGNVSPSCNFQIFFQRPNIYSPELEFPGNVDLECSSGTLECDDNSVQFPNDWDLDGNGYPDPTDVGVGFPTYQGDPFIGGNNYCKINTGFVDQVIGICGNASFKVIRTWTVLDWCDSDSRVFVQSIKVSDTRPPLLVCPNDGLSFNVSDGHCSADVILDPLNSAAETGLQCWYDCSNVTVNVEFLTADDREVNEVDDIFNQAIQNPDGSWTAENVPAGMFWVKYTLTDDCNNSAECRFEATVIDVVEPYAVCDQFTAVALSETGWARANAISFDDGSYDECDENVTFEVRRLQTNCDNEPGYDRNDLEFGPYVQFCCDDASSDYISVVLKVTDSSGNYSTCEVNVEVQDKHGPDIIQCPELEIFLTCDQYHPDSLYGNPNIPIVVDNCLADIQPSYEDVGDIDSQCQSGIIIRKWYFQQGSNKIELTDCFQTINVGSAYNESLFFPGDRDVTCEEFAELNDIPTLGGVPITEYEGCANFAWTTSDLVFNDVEDICFKIIRTHTVIDWCVYVPNSGSLAGYYTEDQTIRVTSTQGAELDFCAEINSVTFDETTCLNVYSMNAPWAFDNCFGEAVTLDNISYDIYTTAGEKIHENLDVPASTFDTPGLGKGSYVLKFIIEDRCGSIIVCETPIEVTETDKIAPNAYCYGGITTVLMEPNIDGDVMVQIWASDFDLGSSDNCTSKEDLIFSFDPEGQQTSITFDCNDVGERIIRIYITDECGNFDYCESTIDLQDNGHCYSASRHMIAGHVFTENNQMIENVEMAMLDMGEGSTSAHATDINGQYFFEDLTASQDYSISAYNNTDHLNGVTTLDLVLIQKHILGLQLLDSPYKMVAADANASESVTAADLVQLRKLILGIYEELPDNQSWRFLDVQQQFADNNPWPFVDLVQIHDLNSDMMTADFIAVKIGDVNESVSLNNVSNSSTALRSENNAVLSIEDLDFKENEVLTIPVNINVADFYGMQFTLDFNRDLLEFVTFESALIDLSQANFIENNNGTVSFSWNKASLVNVNDEAIFNIKFIAKQTGSLANTDIRLSNKGVNAEYYGNALVPESLTIQVVGDVTGDFALFQNEPNPFSGQTSISFALPKEDLVTLTLVDYTGRVLYKEQVNAEKGINEVKIDADVLNQQGVIYYSLSTSFGNKVKKMLLIK